MSTDKFQPDQKVRVRYVDALNRVIWFDGKIIRKEMNLWRVDLGGVAVVFAEEDIHEAEKEGPKHD